MIPMFAGYTRIGKLHLDNHTTNRLECFHAKIKKVINSSKIKMSFLVEKLLSIAIIRSVETKHSYFNATMKTPIKIPNELSDAVAKVSSYALKKMVKQLYFMKSNDATYEVCNNSFVFILKGKLIRSFSDSCTCDAFTGNGLPCWHIFYVRQTLSLHIFDITLVNKKWIINTTVAPLNVSSKVTHVIPSTLYDTREKRFMAAYSIAMKIANILSDESKATFPQALQYLNSIEQQVIRGEWQQHNQIPDGVEAGVTTSILSSLRNSNVQGFETQSCLVESESVDGENLDKVSAINIFKNSLDEENLAVETNNLTNKSINSKILDDQKLNMSIQHLKFPAMAIKQGRPPLPRSQRVYKSTCLKVWEKMTTLEKDSFRLKHVVSEYAIGDILNCARKGQRKDILCNFSAIVCDSRFGLNDLKSYFLADAWRIIQSIQRFINADKKAYRCNDCKSNESPAQFPQSDWVQCDHCINWYHVCCSGITGKSSKKFFCRCCLSEGDRPTNLKRPFTNQEL
ncbi:uncharacterized protein LOC136086571 [Hydra vulgaris]|uniref:Uncharacterized protein LOC136086571 n=1 Tax=Hydra vulgaris TaxID=6087 RepID=A0ABM4CSK2_HYDVU